MEIADDLDELHDAAADLGIVAPEFGTSRGKAYEVWVMLELVVRLMCRASTSSHSIARTRGSPTMTACIRSWVPPLLVGRRWSWRRHHVKGSEEVLRGSEPF